LTSIFFSSINNYLFAMLKKLKAITLYKFLLPTFAILIGITLFFTWYFYNQKSTYAKQLSETYTQLNLTKQQYEKLKSVDQLKRNDELQKQIKDIEETYVLASASYEELIKLGEVSKNTDPLKKQYVQVIAYLSKRNVASAEAELSDLNTKIKAERAKAVAATGPVIPENATINNSAPGSGYSRQYVKTDNGTYLVDIIAADLNSTKVIVDTASDGSCGNDCPVTSLADYAGRSGAFAGVNGPYFCPADYPSCDGKKNSFDTLIMNKNKTYFNSDNNVYSTVPAVIFSAGNARFVGQTLEWGRDTGPDSVIAAQPMLVSGGNVVYGGDDEIKRAGKGSRSFIGASGSTAYIGVVYNANVAEVAVILKTMGIQYALNLDSGGSTALWSNGRYLAGPGRNTPFGILFVNR
jgi:exopolysaccharide biosynthesis protein